MTLTEKLKKLPNKPGIYIMKDSSGEIIYVGKANSLRNRVRQYFQTNARKDRKTSILVEHIADFEYIIVNNEVEALILEANLIKKHKPRYNILLKDDKQYPYVKITLDEAYPRVLKTRIIKKDGSEYFGPYPNVLAVNEVLDMIRESYKIRDCSRNLENGKKYDRPCLNFYIDKCLGPCVYDIDDEYYDNMIKEIIDFFKGDTSHILDILDKEMEKASENLEFEEAARYRDRILSVYQLMERQKIVDPTSKVDQDVIAMARGIEEVSVQVFFIRQGKIMGREHFILEDLYKGKESEILESFVKQFYIAANFIPKEIILETEIEDKIGIENWLSQVKGSKVNITIPQRGKKKKLVEMVKDNAIEIIEKYGDKFLKIYRENLLVLEELQILLDLDKLPKRIEAYDISNISGVQSVGSMVVFENGQSKKSDYRRFKIESVIGPDDYKSMEEIIIRRFIRGKKEKEAKKESGLNLKGFSNFPDLIMIDGGKGQVNIVLKALKELGIDIAVLGLVKNEFHQTRGIIYKNKEYSLKEDSDIYRLIYKIQEEAHRFAISYHRSLRSKDMFKSELDGIAGVGPKRKQNLLNHFKSIEKIKNAEIEELQEAKSINSTVAKTIYNYFRQEKEEK